MHNSTDNACTEKQISTISIYVQLSAKIQMMANRQSQVQVVNPTQENGGYELALIILHSLRKTRL